MTITERTLRKWRGNALEDNRTIHKVSKPDYPLTLQERTMINERILRLTQELLDQHLLRKVVR